jgi:Virulence-associated protein E
MDEVRQILGLGKSYRSMIREIGAKNTSKNSPSVNDDMMAGVGESGRARPRDIDKVALGCPFIADTLTTGGRYLSGDPIWHSTTQIAYYCVEPENTVVRLFEKNPYYTEEGAQQKLSIVRRARETNPKLGFPLCSTLESNGAKPFCDGCKNRKRDKSPLNTPEAYEEGITEDIAATLTERSIEPLRGGTIYARLYNMLAVLPLRFSYDEMHDQCLYGDGPLTDGVLAALRGYFINASDDHKDPTLKQVKEAAEALCDMNHFHPEQDWLNSLAWDGVPRREFLLTRYCKVEGTPLAREVGRALMVAKIKRAFEPGCKHEWALVLEGEQGTGKTTFARILARSSDRITDVAIMGATAQVQQEALRGRTVYEIAEMSDAKKTDVNAIKTFMSRTHDRARGAYKHSMADQGRCCIYIGTVNDQKYLQDEANRRFFPFLGGVIDLVALERDIEQLHAEAVVAYRSGESSEVASHLWAVAAREQRKRRIEDPWEDVIGWGISREIGYNMRKVAPKPGGLQLSSSDNIVEITTKRSGYGSYPLPAS